MQVEFYIDIFFIINLVMNGILLILTGKLRKLKIRRLRMFFASAVGALIACFSALIYAPLIVSLIFDYIITSLIMILIAFGKRNHRIFIQNYVIFLLCTFLLGGLVQSFSNIFREGNHLNGFIHVLYNNKVNIIILILISLVLTPLVLQCYRMIKQNSNVMENLYDVTIVLWEGKQVECKGFMDTGNSLKDPIRGRPVIIADQSLLKEELLLVQTVEPTAFCVIPFTSVGKEDGIMYGFRVESVTIRNLQETISTENVVVALSEYGFANKEEYRVLLHNDLLV